MTADDQTRSRRLAIAGRVASGFTANPETSGQDARRIARWSWDIAEALIRLDAELGEEEKP